MDAAHGAPSQFTPNVRVARGWVWSHRLVPALALVCCASVFLAEVALADTTSVVVAPTSGLAGASLTVDGTYVFTNGCPVGAAPYTVVFNFYWDSPNTPIWSTKTNVCLNRTTYDSGKSPAWVPPGPVATVTSHKIVVNALDGNTGARLGSNSTIYTITSPPPPPPPTTPPPTHRPTPLPPPPSSPSPLPTPSPTCTTEGPPRGCVPVDCTRLAAWLGPVGSTDGVPPLMLALVVAPFLGMVAFTPRLRRQRAIKASAVLVLLVATSCGRCGPPAASPTPAAAAHVVVGFEATPSCRGYWMASNNGGIFPFGDAAGLGSAGAVRLSAPIVGMDATPDGQGYWLVASDGGIFPFGNAVGYGGTGGTHLSSPIVGMESTPDGGGYWLVARDGGIFPFGNAAGYGSTGGIHLSSPIVGMEGTPHGRGYWLVAADGGVFPFGDAAGYGSVGGTHLSSPIVGIEATPDGGGYWLVAADGGIFPFGDAAGYGSLGGTHLSSPIVGMEETPDGRGYWLFAADGGVFPFGDAPGYGSLAGVTF
jgi:hypothetical protein